VGIKWQRFFGLCSKFAENPTFAAVAHPLTVSASPIHLSPCPGERIPGIDGFR
jgi:hypothetical protein